MLLCFLAAWPVNTLKAYRARTARGTSLGFMLIVEIGYLCGLASKFLAGSVNFVAAFYVINICVVGVNIGLYFRNRMLDSGRACRRWLLHPNKGSRPRRGRFRTGFLASSWSMTWILRSTAPNITFFNAYYSNAPQWKP